VDERTASMPPPALRRAADADADAIARLVDAAYRHYEALIGRTPIPMLADYAVAVREHDVWVLEADGQVIGVLELAPREDHLWVENVAVDPGRQGLGLGQRLLMHAEEEARRRGLRELRLLTNELYATNLAMYARYGYHETHREPYLGTDLVHLTKPVQPAERS
jgi:N-acetylglutamate synthase-like GNAT family acetyltransferase